MQIGHVHCKDVLALSDKSQKTYILCSWGIISTSKRCRRNPANCKGLKGLYQRTYLCQYAPGNKGRGQRLCQIVHCLQLHSGRHPAQQLQKHPAVVAIVCHCCCQRKTCYFGCCWSWEGNCSAPRLPGGLCVPADLLPKSEQLELGPSAFLFQR